MTGVESPGDRGKSFCDAKKRQGPGCCRRPAGWGTQHVGVGRCKLHGGSTQSQGEAVKKVLARRAVETYGLPVEIDPRDAVLQEVYYTAGAVAYLKDRVRELDADELIWGITAEDEIGASEFSGVNVKREAKPHIWRQLLMEERKHLVAVCKTAHDIGIEDRKIKLAESYGSQLAIVVRAVLNGIGATPQQWELVPDALSHAIEALTSGDAPTSP